MIYQFFIVNACNNFKIDNLYDISSNQVKLKTKKRMILFLINRKI